MEADIGLLDEMIGRLLTLAKMDASALQISMTDVDVADLLSDVIRDAEFESRDPHSCVVVRSSGEHVVRGDAELLHSALENVIRNAIRFTGDGKPIEVQMQADDGPGKASVRLSVRDYGPGVPESELKNIFEPFYRGASARDRQSGGTGLGLAIAERVVDFTAERYGLRTSLPRGYESRSFFRDLRPCYSRKSNVLTGMGCDEVRLNGYTDASRPPFSDIQHQPPSISSRDYETKPRMYGVFGGRGPELKSGPWVE